MTSSAELAQAPFWALPQAERMAAFRRLRGLERPVFVPERSLPFVGGGPGYYALVRHADVVEAGRNAAVFGGEPGAGGVPGLPAWLSGPFGPAIDLDDPRHVRLRGIVARAFSPRILAKLEDDLAAAAAEIVDRVIEEGPGDFVAQVAAKLPVRVICDMMGIPAKFHDMVLRRTDIILSSTGPQPTGPEHAGPEHAGPEDTGIASSLSRVDVARGLARLLHAGFSLTRLAARLGDERRRRPTGDLVSLLVNGDERLTSRELGSFFVLLVVAGSETTRNAIAYGLKLLTDHPGQRELLLERFDERIVGACEEIVRYATPVIQFRRTLTRDHEMNGVAYKRGDKVLLFYNSANRDEAVFADPDTFDITRDPNPHVGFGVPGPHHCLGAHLARREMTVMFRELFTRLPAIRSVGEPDFLPSNFVNGVRRLRHTF
ncbi:cytochrome P450 [Nonomuraea sp. K274]|uniref:Cytochrome P450 n=1 Tax=Nonomuraea cypriaca TaxID=1187855 RepID=A0A931F766_9ACTN|nr:cytochrome P450 [Nonomuraea cypriaca]MBF8193851.1 cytochrome P450 [Nonomuraea cypriaca]